MSVFAVKAYDRDGYPVLRMIIRDEVRGYEFTVDPHGEYYCLLVRVTTSRDLWYIPLWGDTATQVYAPSRDVLVHETGIFMAADLDPSSPDVDVTWAWDIEAKKWERSEKR